MALPGRALGPGLVRLPQITRISLKGLTQHNTHSGFAPRRGVIERVRQGWPDSYHAAILATSMV